MTEGQKRRNDRRQGPNKKHKYSGHVKGSGHAVPAGSRGLLITVDQGRERKAGSEMVAVVEEHYNKLLPAKADEAASKDDKPKDISAMIAAEVADLKDKSKRTFKWHDTQVQGTVYIQFPEEPAEPTPLAVAMSICKEAEASKQLCSRYVSRVLPVTHACFADLEAIKKMAAELVAAEPSFAADAEPVEFSIEYEHRSAGKFDRMDVINAFVDHIKTPPHKVNLNKPGKTVLVNIIRNICTAAVLTSYKDMGKYNLRKLADVLDEQQGGKQQQQGQGKQQAQKEEQKEEAAAAGGEEQQEEGEKQQEAAGEAGEAGAAAAEAPAS